MSGIAFEDALKASRAYSLIRGDFRLGLGHAYMVVSADDEIVDEFFNLIGATVFCETNSACLECPECLKVMHNNHPDVFHVNPLREKIKVGDIKEMLYGVGIKPLSGRKLYFVHRADLMSKEAQNKLLKTLEEPPKSVTIFLGVANEAGMLDTVKSRARSVYMDLFDSNTVYQEMLSLGCDKELSGIAAACSEGQLGKAHKIALSPQYSELYKTALNLLANLKKSTDVLRFDTLGALQKNPDEFLGVLSIVLRDMLVSKQNPGLMLSKHIGADISALAQSYSARAISEIIFSVNEARKKLSLNVNAAATADSLLFSILEVKYKWQ